MFIDTRMYCRHEEEDYAMEQLDFTEAGRDNTAYATTVYRCPTCRREMLCVVEVTK